MTDVMGLGDALAAVLDGRGLVPGFQPIVDLATGAVVAHESLIRGPEGPWHTPGELFAGARAVGRLAEFDSRCRSAAFGAASGAGPATPDTLFLNVEPDGIPVGPPPEPFVRWLRSGRRLVLEFTERAVTVDPARLQWFATRLRRKGAALALDDVGRHPGSLALMPFLQPEVVKLDMSLVQGPLDDAAARTVAAVAEYAERSGATIVAEGIETAEHELTARAMGASLGQGFRFGRPGPLGPDLRPYAPRDPRLDPRAPYLPGRRSPFAAVSRSRAVRRGPEREVEAAAALLERRAFSAASPTVLLASAGPPGETCPVRISGYGAAARTLPLVALLGLDGDVPDGVRGAALEAGDPLRRERDIAVVGPDVAGALVSRADGRGGFEYAVVHDRDLVLEVARSLMSRIVPAPTAEPPLT